MDLGEQRLEVLLSAGQVFVSQDPAAERGEAPFEHAREARPIRLVVVDDERRAETQLAHEFRGGAALAIVGRTHAKERVHVGVRAAQARRFVALGQQRARRRGADLHDAGVVRHRDLRLGDVRVVGADHAQHRRVRDERLHVLHALRRIVNALHRVVERHRHQREPADRVARVGLLDREDRTVLRGDADRRVGAADGEIDADADRAGGRGGRSRRRRARAGMRRRMRAVCERDDAERRDRSAQDRAA